MIERKKQKAAETAMEYIKPDAVVGVGTGSTVNYFIESLAGMRHQLEAVAASSQSTANQLKAKGFQVADLNTLDRIDIYVDGADEFNTHFQMIKGAGGAHTGEKILAAASERFVAIVDDEKASGVLGEKAPVPIEVLPMARSLVARAIVKEGGEPVYREGAKTDFDNVILDVYNLHLLNPLAMERQLNQLVGTVANGIFAKYPADIMVVGTAGTAEVYHR